MSIKKRLPVNDIYIPLFDNKSRFLIVYGGSGSGKSDFSAHKIIKRTLTEKGHKFLCLRKVGNTIHDSIFAELQAAISKHEADSQFVVNHSNHTFLHVPTGNMILCKGLDEPGKIKSIKGITGMWLEEASDFDEADLDQLNLRIRGKKAHYVQYILSFNPIDENHWLKKRFFDKKDSEATTCHSTYKDNLFLEEEDRATLEKLKERNELFYDVYCLGKWGVVDKSNKFFYAYRKDKHERDGYEPNPHLPLTISFDFNVEPMTSIVGQKLSDLHGVVFDCLKIELNGSVEEMCEMIKAKYPMFLDNIDVCGDATGRAREKVRIGNLNSWIMIKNEFKLLDRNILVPSVNPEIKDSKVLVNSVLQHANFQVTKNCEDAINDMIYTSTKMSDKGKLEIVKTADKGAHFADNCRYIIHCWFPDFIKNPKKYR